MRATIYDSAALNAITPVELAAYLRARGWVQTWQNGDRAAFWSYSADATQFDIIMPLRRELADYNTRMAETLDTLEVVERRSQLEIIRDLFTASCDVVRLRARPDGSSSGMVRMDEGVELVQYARELVMAAACSTDQKKAVFSSRKPNKALNYIKNAKFGQTEQGSYVITLISPVSVTFDTSSKDELFPDGPFRRQVIETLASAVSNVRSAALTVAVTGNIKVFDETIRNGVSANLCDAIVGLSRVSPNDGFSIDFSWAAALPTSETKPESIQIASDSVSIIEDAARHFREITPREEFTLEGIVVSLKREPGSPIGYVKLLGFIDEKPRSVSIQLREMDYQLAVQAHKQHQPVSCVGELLKEGRSFELRNARSFGMRGEDDEPTLL
jgi:hypothetical protein